MLEKYLVILAVGAFVKDSEGKILVVKKSMEEKIDPGLWTVPGGKIVPEEAIVEGLKREVQEESGLLVTSYRWIGEDVFISDDKHFHAQHFLCEVQDTSHVVLERKLLEYKWITEKDMEALEFHPNIRKRLMELFQKQI